MLCDYVGQEKFLKGVSIYLKKHLFANSVTHDLWDGISSSTGLEIPKLMENWITKVGFPVLTVTENKEGITVRQDRFLETGAAKPEDNETLWYVTFFKNILVRKDARYIVYAHSLCLFRQVPLNIVSESNGERSVARDALLREREAHFELDTRKQFKLNAGTNGFCK